MKTRIINIGWTLLRVLAAFWILGGVIRIILGSLVIYAGETQAGGLTVASGIIIIAIGVLLIRLCDRRDAKREAEGQMTTKR